MNINLCKKCLLDILKKILQENSSIGTDVCEGLIGLGVSASHGMERSHYKALENTVKLLCSYLTKKHQYKT